MAASAEVTTLLRLFDYRFSEVEELLSDLPAEALLWKPFDESPWKGPSGQLGWLVAHALSSTVYLLRRAQWVNEHIEWKQVEGDEGREEFGPANHDPAWLLARSRRVQAFVHELLPTFSAEMLAATRPHARRPEVIFTARQEVVHALDHLAQHLGHAQLTRQLWALQAAQQAAQAGAQ